MSIKLVDIPQKKLDKEAKTQQVKLQLKLFLISFPLRKIILKSLLLMFLMIGMRFAVGRGRNTCFIK